MAWLWELGEEVLKVVYIVGSFVWTENEIVKKNVFFHKNKNKIDLYMLKYTVRCSEYKYFKMRLFFPKICSEQLSVYICCSVIL